MKKNWPDEQLGNLIADALRLDSSSPDFCSDEQFLLSLNARLHQVKREPPAYRVWLNGLMSGTAAAAAGFILFIGMNVLPPIFVKDSVANIGIFREQVVNISIQQRNLWQQLVINLESSQAQQRQL
jgi:hypothetical protein